MAKFLTQPLFIILLPFVFYLFRLSECAQYLSARTIGYDFLQFMSWILVVYFIVFYFFSKNANALIICFIGILIFLFFVDIKLSITHFAPLRIFGSYKLLIPTLTILCSLLYFLLKRFKNLTTYFYEYLNYLMLMLFLLQSGITLSHLLQPKPKAVQPLSFNKVVQEKLPNIYFILLDGYAGHMSLNEYFKYDNQNLKNFLRNQGYFVADTFFSNYDKTIVSMNSILNMQYINADEIKPWNEYAIYLKSFPSIRNNQLTNFLIENNYHIKNLSPFDIQTSYNEYCFKRINKKANFFYRSTLLRSLKNDFGWMLSTGIYIQDYFYHKWTLHLFHQNQDAIEQTISYVKSKKHKRSFVYTHLLLPHEPYFTDSIGNIIYKSYTANPQTEAGYLAYLKYANTQIKKLSDSICHWDSEAVTVFLSDHGYREYPNKLSSLPFNNLMAIKFPNKDYKQVEKVKSNVNLFRTILNQFFSQSLPLINDSLIQVSLTDTTINQKSIQETYPAFMK